MEAYVFTEQQENEVCSHCKMSVHKIDVKGRKFTTAGEDVPYQICRGCCSMVRYYNFHKDVDKIQHFWQSVWRNINVYEPTIQINEPVAEI